MGHSSLLTVPDVARRLAISEPTVWRLIRGNQIPAVRIGRATRISEHAVGRFVERRERFDCGAIPASPMPARVVQHVRRPVARAARAVNREEGRDNYTSGSGVKKSKGAGKP